MADKIDIAMPFSFREDQYHKAEDIVIDNDYCPLTMQIRLFKDFDTALEHFKTFFNSMKRSFDPFGTYFAFKLNVELPYNVATPMVTFMSSKVTMVFSNVHMLKKEISWNNAKQTGQFYFVPGLGKLSCGVSLSTMGNVMGIGIFSDENAIKDVDEFLAIFMKKLETVLGADQEKD